MATIIIPQNEYDDFMSEEDTQPYVSVSAAQRELDGAESILGQFTARARALGYSEERPEHWTERLEASLDNASILDSVEMDA